MLLFHDEVLGRYGLQDPIRFDMQPATKQSLSFWLRLLRTARDLLYLLHKWFATLHGAIFTIGPLAVFLYRANLPRDSRSTAKGEPLDYIIMKG